MPSLRIDNKDKYSIHDHYRHYLPQKLHYNHETLEEVLNIKNIQSIRSQDNYNTSQWLIYLKYIFTLCISCIAINIYSWMLGFMNLNYNYLIVFLFDEFYLICQALFVFIFCKAFIPNNKYYKKLSFIIWFIFNIIISTIISLIMHYNLHTHDNDKYYFDMKFIYIGLLNPAIMPFLTIIILYISTQFICSKYVTKNAIQSNSKQPEYQLLHSGSQSIIPQGSTELVHVDSNGVSGTSEIDRSKPQGKHLTISSEKHYQHRNSSHHTKSSKSLKQLIDDEPSMQSRSSDFGTSYSFSLESRSELLDHSMNDINTFHHEVPHNSNPLRHEGFIFYQFLFFVIWFLFWVWIYFALYVLPHSDLMKRNRERSWEYFYIIFICFMVPCKWLLKRTSRCLDECQITASKLRLLFSLECFMEYFCDIVYWSIFRIIVSYYVLSYEVLFEILIIHFMTEWWVSSVMFSKKYYDISKQIMTRFDKGYDQKCSVCIQFIHERFKDASNIHQWRVRCGLDCVTRFNVVLLTALFQLLLNFLVNDDVRHYTDNRGNVFNAIVIGLELIYFAFGVFLYHYFMNGVNIFYGFIGLLEWQDNTMKYVIFTNCIVLSIVYMFGFLGFLSLNY